MYLFVVVIKKKLRCSFFFKLAQRTELESFNLLTILYVFIVLNVQFTIQVTVFSIPTRLIYLSRCQDFGKEMRLPIHIVLYNLLCSFLLPY